MEKNNENDNVGNLKEQLAEAQRKLAEEKQRSDRAAEMRTRAKQRLKEKEAHVKKLQDRKDKRGQK